MDVGTLKWLVGILAAPLLIWILNYYRSKYLKHRQKKAELDSFYRAIKVIADETKILIPQLVTTVNKVCDDFFGDRNDSKILIPQAFSASNLDKSFEKVSLQLTAEQLQGVDSIKRIVDLYSQKRQLLLNAETRTIESTKNCLFAVLALYYTSSRMLTLKERYCVDHIPPDELKDKVLAAFRFKIQLDKRPLIANF
jgi:hypothetical protein